MQNKSNSSDVLQRVNDVYAKLSSYQDRGISKVCFHPGTEKEWSKEYSFQTFFKRPAHFRISWSKLNEPESKTYFVIRLNDEVKLNGPHGQRAWHSGESDEVLLGVLMAVETSLLFVPHLLIPGALKRITSLRDSTIDRGIKLFGEDCLEVAGSLSPRTQVKLTASNTNYLIRDISASTINSEDYSEAPEKNPFESIQAFSQWMSLNQDSSKEPSKRESSPNVRPETFASKTSVKYELVRMNEAIGDEEFSSGL